MMMFLAIKNDMQNSFRPLSRGPFFNSISISVIRCIIRRRFRPLSRGPFFNNNTNASPEVHYGGFVPFLGDFFSITTLTQAQKFTMGVSSPFLGTFFQLQILLRGESKRHPVVFVPFLGDLFSIACLRSPSPSALASTLAAGMGDRFIRHSPSEMKCRFSQSGRASAGICNEKIEMRNGGAAHKNMEPPRRFETSDFLVSQT